MWPGSEDTVGKHLTIHKTVVFEVSHHIGRTEIERVETHLCTCERVRARAKLPKMSSKKRKLGNRKASARVLGVVHAPVFTGRGCGVETHLSGLYVYREHDSITSRRKNGRRGGLKARDCAQRYAQIPRRQDVVGHLRACARAFVACKYQNGAGKSSRASAWRALFAAISQPV